MKKALITGINGQDGSYLAELLLNNGYEVYGIIRRSSFENRNKLINIKHILDKIHLYPCSLEDHLAIFKLIKKIRPDECYHLAAQSFVNYSFENDSMIMSINFNSTLNLLTSINELSPHCRFYFAGSSEMFGNPDISPQNEKTRFNPRSLYGISKLASYYLVTNFRERNGLYACTGISYNHESPRRGYQFVTRKITSGLAKIYTGKIETLELGNIDAIRDWGYAPDYVKAMWMMLNNPEGPKDYVIATGNPHSVRDFLETAFSILKLDYKDYIVIKRDLIRNSENIPLIGDSSNIQHDLGWSHSKSFHEIVEEMVLNDLKFEK
jgi:GDPmannose 4,6-dehydratase